MDPFTASAMAQAAIKGIRACCEMLSEGKAEIQKIKKAVGDAKEIAKEVSGFWSWLTGLFGGTGKTHKAADVGQTSTTQVKEEYITHIPSEDEVVDQFAKHLGEYFRIQSWWIKYREEQREKIFNNVDGTTDNHVAALDLVMIEHKMEIFGAELRELMTSGAPRQLGPLYTKFNEMYAKVNAEQRKALEARRKKQALARAQANEQQEENNITKWVWYFSMALLAYCWWFIWVASWQKR